MPLVAYQSNNLVPLDFWSLYLCRSIPWLQPRKAIQDLKLYETFRLNLVISLNASFRKMSPSFFLLWFARFTVLPPQNRAVFLRQVNNTGNRFIVQQCLCASSVYFPYTHNRKTYRQKLFFTPTRLWRWNRQSVPKRWNIKFGRRGITQKKAYRIQNKAKVRNQELLKETRLLYKMCVISL